MTNLKDGNGKHFEAVKLVLKQRIGYPRFTKMNEKAALMGILFTIFFLGLANKAVTTDQCNGPRQIPIRGKMLKGHIYETRLVRSGYAECLFICREEKVCQSFNFVVNESRCEFNNRTKEACNPEDFVSDPHRLYVKLDVSRGALSSSSILGSLDSKYTDQLNSYLDPVRQSPGRSRFVRCWHAKTDGWAASTFHSNCDGKGPTVTIVQVGNYTFGGYTDKSWAGSCVYVSSNKSFLFSLYNINGYAPVKLNIKSSRYGNAVATCPNDGPIFGGGHDLLITNNAASNRNSYTSCGHTYPLPPGYSAYGGSCQFYAGSYKFTPTDVEVFYQTKT